MTDVWAVVVLHHPDAELLRQQFAATMPQVQGIIYHDNGAGRSTLSQLGVLAQPCVRCLGDGNNLGLAEAFNRGLELLVEMQARFALLLDQDSLPARDMVQCLRAADRQGRRDGTRVAAIGPAIYDTWRGRLEPFGQATSLRRRLVSRARDNEPFDVSYLISSGTMLYLPALAEIGPMESGLFIDSIDYEWSFRARARGHRLLATYGTILQHRRGERLHRPLPSVRLRLHSPQRLFFIHRNQVRLCFRRYISLAWKGRAITELVLRMALSLLFGPDRRRRLAASMRGIVQGLRQGRTDRAAETSGTAWPWPRPVTAASSSRLSRLWRRWGSGGRPISRW
jgi:rhamnosyltransferase